MYEFFSPVGGSLVTACGFGGECGGEQWAYLSRAFAQRKASVGSTKRHSPGLQCLSSGTPPCLQTPASNDVYSAGLLQGKYSVLALEMRRPGIV